MLIIEQGNAKFVTLGSDILNDQVPQLMVSKNLWFGGRLKENDEADNGCGWALIGATVAPGFEFEDFESCDRDKLIKEMPDLKDVITKYTYPPKEQNAKE